MVVRIFFSNYVFRMSTNHSFLCFFFVCISVLYSFTYADECVKKSSCVCEFSNGTGIDLTPSAKPTFYDARIYEVRKDGQQFALNTYFYHPCFDAVPSLNATLVNNTCTEALSLCRHVNTLDRTNDTTGKIFQFDSGIYEYMGTSNNTEFSADGSSIIYHNGPSSTIVLLVCAEGEDKLYVYSVTEPNKIVLSFYSRYACLRQIEEPGRSFGSTILIIFFSFVVFYLVLGICTKKFLMGATGIEVIPNLGFWTDLPNLVKDGWAFMINGFRLPARGAGPATSPDPNSYDSI
ncbi:uncharacterized protein [Battus philenor]|uniref:uncharacterized protein n=1 Tax=Battus philenor TaxID=42288 RepID=UPI0035D0CA82